MKNIFQKLSVAALVLISISCSDTFDDDIVRDSIPATPILFTGAYSVGFNPYYTVAYSTGTITLTLEIPASSARTFKSIDRMIAGTSSLTPGSVAASTPANYFPTISASGKSVVINTSIAEFNTKVTGSTIIPASWVSTAAGAIPASPPTFAKNYHERAFMFRVILDDDSTIIPEQVRIRVTY